MEIRAKKVEINIGVLKGLFPIFYTKIVLAYVNDIT